MTKKHQDLLNSFLPLTREEKLYRRLYRENPELYAKPTRSWNEIVERYSKKKLPSDAPTQIKEILSRDDCFPEKDLSVTVIRHVRYTPPFLHYHSFIKILYAMRGSCVHINDGYTITIKEGDFCIVPPYMVNTTFAYHDEDIIFNILLSYDTFSTDFMGLLTEHDTISDFFWQIMYHKRNSQLLVFQNIGDNILDEIILDIVGEVLYDKKPNNMLLKGYIMLFFGNVLKNHTENAIVYHNIKKRHKYIGDILSYINENISSVTLSTLADRFQFSNGYISRLLRKETGLSFNQLLMEARLRIASEMLANSNLNISEIIDAIGYLEPSRFYKNFKKKYKMTPLSYRKGKTFSLPSLPPPGHKKP
ncbi:MAG: AraC family transcriptional regulator [Spirochaetaceae bacterium]|jgi:AraC-like DNA-binding protein|nr:AraC family transcriptional regulator [Spirochaetaceae bacterium]